MPISATHQAYLLQAEDACDKARGGPDVVERHGEVPVDLLLLWPILLALGLSTAARPLSTSKLMREALQASRGVELLSALIDSCTGSKAKQSRQGSLGSGKAQADHRLKCFLYLVLLH